MRTHQKHGILLAGVNGYKIYAKGEGYRLVRDNRYMDLAKSDFATVVDYVNLKYQPIAERENIITAFLRLTEGVFK